MWAAGWYSSYMITICLAVQSLMERKTTSVALDLVPVKAVHEALESFGCVRTDEARRLGAPYNDQDSQEYEYYWWPPLKNFEPKVCIVLRCNVWEGTMVLSVERV